MGEEEIDVLDEPLAKPVTYRFSTIPSGGPCFVSVPPVWTSGKGSLSYFDEYGLRTKTEIHADDLDSCYFCLNLDLIDNNKPKTVELKPDFYNTEFLALNPFNIEELLEFQNKFGLIMGARGETSIFSGTKRLRPVPNEYVFAGDRKELYSEQYAGILASQKLFDSLPDDEEVEEFESLKLSTVSFHESIATVIDAQRTIRETTKVLRADIETITMRDAGIARFAAEYLAANLSRSNPTVELVAKGSAPRPVPLMTGVYSQLARGLVNNEAYRQCRNIECKCLFTPREKNRRSDTLYCSVRCQERAKRLRYLANQKKRK